jgi:hypothetical protein
MLRPNETFHIFLPFLPFNLTPCYQRMNPTLGLFLAMWQTTCYDSDYTNEVLSYVFSGKIIVAIAVALI